ncbi:MAG: PTS sugar transporter subunit IIA [Treponema sp.]|jgi:PTS system nitrogen regulatory IIA component|nr:PTS sugar transporter subunit IIA [Treponema sp.]
MRTTNSPFILTGSNRKNIQKTFGQIKAANIIFNLKSETKEAAITELLDLLSDQGKLIDRDAALRDLLDREQTMSTAIPNGIAIPHAKTNAVQELTVTVGIKKSGLDFDSALDDKTRIIILALAPPVNAKSLYKFLLAITATLNDDTLRSEILAAKTAAEVVELLHQYK